MKRIIINGGNELKGEIKISGAKNSAVALVPASLLCDGVVTIDNIPNISDIDALNDILEYLGAKVKRKEEVMIIDSSSIKNKEIPESISKKLRASYYFMGALLGKYKHVEMYFPGGCSIGARPINLHIKAFKELGAKVKEEGNKFTITAHKLKGAHIYFDVPSVGATINTMLVACKAEGTTIIDNAAKEPELVNIATFLNQMGADIKGAGTSQIVINGVKKLNSCYIEVIPDRIEAGTYLIAGALMGNKLKVTNLIPDHIDSLTTKMKEMGVPMTIGDDYIIVSRAKKMNPVDVRTLGYPGFATDLQQPFTTLLTQAKGISSIEETIYENRFQNIPYLDEMGADIQVDNRRIRIKGPSKLKGTIVKATDLRAGACLVLAGIAASGKTTIMDADHILRGYENIESKLKNVGVNITIDDINE